MIIIPVERKLDWKRPPWLTLTLIIVNAMVFVLYQSGDSKLIQQAVEQYQRDDLLVLEAPVYESYLRRQANVHEDAQAQEQLDALSALPAPERDQILTLWLLQDPAFYAYAQENGGRYWQDAELTRWSGARENIQSRYLDRISSQRFGLKPDEVRIADLVLYQFMHGGWEHLLGNMLFLFLLGFAVEQALGALRYLLTYLICGVFSGLAFALIEGFDGPPLVGASGSISGLMGIYIALYGRQRIRFFYFVGVYFNYLKAPALLMLPLWAGKELWQYFAIPGSNVAYMAHLGGLLAGASLIGLFHKNWLRVEEAFLDVPEDEQDAQFRKEYAMALASLERFEFKHACAQFAALRRRYPDRWILSEHLYQLAKLRPSEPAYLDHTVELMGLALRQNRLSRLTEVWDEYQKLAGELRPLGAADHNRVLFAALKAGDLKTADRAFGRLQATGEALLIEEACRFLVVEMDKRQLGTRAEKYRRMLA